MSVQEKQLALFAVNVIAAYSDKINHTKPFYSLVEAAAEFSGLRIDSKMLEKLEGLTK